MDEPPGWLSLSNDEEILYFGRPSKWVLAPELVMTVIVSVVTAAVIRDGPFAGARIFGYRVQDYLIGMFVLSLVFIGVMEVRRRFTGHAVTTQGLYRKRWIIGRDPKFVPINSVQQIEWPQQVYQRVFRVADMRFYTAAEGAESAEMEWEVVPHPSAVASKVNASVSGQNPTATVDTQDAVTPPLNTGTASGLLSRLVGSDDGGAQLDSDGASPDLPDGEGDSTAQPTTEQDEPEDNNSDSVPRGFH